MFDANMNVPKEDIKWQFDEQLVATSGITIFEFIDFLRILTPKYLLREIPIEGLA